jgi:hypothetical protein
VHRWCPWALSAEAEQAILTARARTNWGPMRLTYLTGRHRSTVWVSATLRHAADWFTEQGCGPLQAVMSDDAKRYATSREFRDTLTELGLGARHILIPPYTPRWNGQDRALLRHA